MYMAAVTDKSHGDRLYYLVMAGISKLLKNSIRNG